MTISNLDTSSLTGKELKDLKLLALFTSVYCEAHHHGQERVGLVELTECLPGCSRYRYCSECRALLLYAMERRVRCPLEPKPSCKRCPVHCYRPGHRERVREVMRYSGKTLIRRGRLDLLWHYLF